MSWAWWSPVVQKDETGIPRASWLAKTSYIGEFWVCLRDSDSMNKVEGNSRRLGILYMCTSVQERVQAHVLTHLNTHTHAPVCHTHMHTQKEEK